MQNETRTSKGPIAHHAALPQFSQIMDSPFSLLRLTALPYLALVSGFSYTIAQIQPLDPSLDIVTPSRAFLSLLVLILFLLLLFLSRPPPLPSPPSPPPASLAQATLPENHGKGEDLGLLGYLRGGLNWWGTKIQESEGVGELDRGYGSRGWVLQEYGVGAFQQVGVRGRVGYSEGFLWVGVIAFRDGVFRGRVVLGKQGGGEGSLTRKKQRHHLRTQSKVDTPTLFLCTPYPLVWGGGGITTPQYPEIYTRYESLHESTKKLLPPKSSPPHPLGSTTRPSSPSLLLAPLTPHPLPVPQLPYPSPSRRVTMPWAALQGGGEERRRGGDEERRRRGGGGEEGEETRRGGDEEEEEETRRRRRQNERGEYFLKSKEFSKRQQAMAK
eukprot:766657-Hanusia_phi.AAC.3